MERNTELKCINTVILSFSLVQKFCGSADALQNFGRFDVNSEETVRFHKISTPGNWVKLRYIMQCFMLTHWGWIIQNKMNFLFKCIIYMFWSTSNLLTWSWKCLNFGTTKNKLHQKWTASQVLNIFQFPVFISFSAHTFYWIFVNICLSPSNIKFSEWLGLLLRSSQDGIIYLFIHQLYFNLA